MNRKQTVAAWVSLGTIPLWMASAVLSMVRSGRSLLYALAVIIVAATLLVLILTLWDLRK